MNLKTTNRILSFILALIMVLGFLPANALAVFADGDEGPVRAGDEGYPDGYDPNSQASVYAYNRWGSGLDPRISVSIDESENNTSTPMAGDTLNYVLRYTYSEIPEINFGYPKAMPIYDFYKNNKLTLVLPAGLLLKGQESPKGVVAVPDNQDPTVSHTYTFELPDVYSNDPQQFSISVYVCNNGTDQSVATYDPMSVTFHTEFDVIDYTGGNETQVGHYKQDVSAVSDPVVTTTPDRWGVEKSIRDGYPKFNDSKTKAIFSWEVKVGLLDNDGKLITDVGLYNRPGRDAVEGIWLKDTFSTLLSKDGSSPYGTITITKGSNSSQWYTTGTEIEIELKDGLALDVSATADMISTNGTSDPNYLIAVPTLTTYTVTAEYDVTSEMLAKFYENPYELNSKNKAEVTRYKLADVDQENGNETPYYPEDLELPVTEPASITIGKLLREFAAGNMSNPYDDRYGDITFKITNTSSQGGIFTVYEYRESPAPHYVPIEGMTNVTSATLKKGVTYYLLPGHTYNIEEVLSTEQLGYMVPEALIVNRGKVDESTKPISVYYSAIEGIYLSEGEEFTVDFVNKEVRGKIIVIKKDDGDNPVKNVVFALKDASGNYIYDSNNELITATTGDDGKATFKNLPLGTYQVVEYDAPEGYVMDPDPQSVTLTGNSTEQDITKTFINRRNGATLTLTKWVAISEAEFKTKANASFTGTFSLYRRLQGTTSWGDPITVNGETELTVGTNGTISAVLPPFNDSGVPYEYKFVETIPAGFYDPATGSTTTAETEPVTLTKVENGIVVAADKSVNMYNRKLVKAHIQKKFYSVGADGKLALDDSKTTTATLYTYIGSDTSTLAALTGYTNFTIGGGTDGEPVWVDFSNLKLYDGADRIHYLIKEVALSGYTLDTGSLTGAVVTIGGVDYIELAISEEMTTASSMTNAVEADQPAAEAVLNNIQQLIPVKVVKYDFYTGTYVSGSKYTVYEADGTVASDEKNNGRTLNAISVPQDGDVFYLVPGQVYTFIESSIPDGYYLHSYTDANGTKVETTVEDVKYGTIDLTGEEYVLSFADVGTDKTVERRINNYRDPLIRIMKKDTGTATVSGAKFTVYKAVKNDNGDILYYEAITDENAIDSNVDSDVRLPEGEYYIAETTVPTGYLDPDENYTLYHSLDSSYVQGPVGSETGTVKTFKKVTVTNGKGKLLNGGTDNICAFEFKNIKNTGSLKVLKKVYDALASGFMIVVKNAAGEVVKEQQTDSKGAAVFTDLPVYDADGNLIEYTITERLLDSQGNYYQASEDQIATLTPDSQTTTDIDDNTLVVVNHTKVEVNVKKVFQRTWDHAFTQMEYLMQDATIGLFVKEGDNWKLIESKQTDENGMVSFSGLRRDMEYALVELASSDPTMFPNKDGEWLKYPSDDGYDNLQPGDLIPDIDNYNVSYLTSAKMSEDYSKSEFTVAELVNANHWVQFDITKWLDADTYNPSEGEVPVYGTEVDKSEDRRLDNAVFDLYRYIMPGDTGSVTFDPAADPFGGEGWELIGSYTSGTKYGYNGLRQIGEFMTNVDQGIDDHYVYLLVERDAGPNGGVINPYFEYTFWQADWGPDVEDKYTITITGHEVRKMNYTMDEINYDDILNAHPVGPGNGVIYLASIRIAKWQDEFDWKTGEWSKNYTPLPNTTFVVKLNNASREVIATMTTGLDAAAPGPSGQTPMEKAWAQSGVYLLGISESNGTVTYTLKDYEKGTTFTSADGLVVEPFEVTKDGVTYQGYRIPVMLIETGCPEGYSYDETGYEMYLCFVNLIGNANGTSWVFNDAFFVTEAGNKGADTEQGIVGTPYTLATDGTETAWYVTKAENYDNISDDFFLGDDESQRRIVDYPIHNTFVTVHKYGYKPNETTTADGGMTSAQLDDQQKEAISREALPGVTMYLQHRKADGTWEFWDYATNTATTDSAKAKFVTVEAGAYIFPDGLKPGTYRIYETSLPTDVESTIYANGNVMYKINEVYEMAYYDNTSDHTSANSHPHARIFTVGAATTHVTMYNPKMVDLTLIKEDLNGNGLASVNFSLVYGSTSSPSSRTAITDSTGKVTFRNIASRNYWLIESKVGYSSMYLQQYLKSVDPALANLAVAGTGVRIGYTYGTSGDTTERDTVISAITPNYLTPDGSADLTLTIKNPEQGKIEITKVDERNNAITTGAASFYAYYLPFTQVATDDGYEFKNVFTSSPSTATELTAAGFTRFPNSSTTLKTDSNGVLKVARKTALPNQTNDDLTNLDPGIYAFIETAAPAGYDKLTTTDGKEVIYFVIVTGGMTVTVTGLAESVETWAGTVDTLTSGEVTDNVEKAVFSAKNYQKVTLKAMKELVYPEGATADSWSIFKPWEVRLDLYSSDKKTVLGSATFTSVSTEAVTFKKNGADVQLSQGETYYVKEAVVAPANAFGLVKLLADGTEVTGTDGFYPVTVSKDGIVVTAQNEFMWGQVKFKKYDGDDIANNDFSNPLEGAEFVVRYNKNAGIAGAEEDWVKVDGSSVTYDATTKTYIADIPLLSESPTTYRIYETKAPENHLLNTNLYLEVEVPQMIDGKLTNVIDYSDSHVFDEYLVNTEGNKIILYKYDNLFGSKHTVGQGDASFVIYHRTSVDPVAWEVVMPQTATDGDGKVTYLTTPGEVYAIVETAWATSKFIGLDGVYRVTGEGENAVETLLTEVVTIDGKDAYIIVSSREPETIVLKAYNKPLIKPMIVKQDAGSFPKDIVPIAFFSIYKISDDFVINDANVEALIAALNEDGTPVNVPVYEGNTNAGNTYTSGGTYGLWDAAENGGEYWDPTCRYIIVETKVASGTAGKDYNTLNKDDNRVIWYVEVPVTLDVDELDPSDPPVFILKNVYGMAEADLVKSVVNNNSEGITSSVDAADTDNAVVGNKVESLLTGSRKVIYLIKPSVKSVNQALESFIITDSGITFNKKKAGYNGGPQPTYSIDSIVIGAAGQDYSLLDFTIPDNTVVSAKVTFTFADGSSETKIVQNLSEAREVKPTAGKGKVQSFVIEYYSEGVSTATGGKYALGYGFFAENITVNVTIDKLPDGNSGEPVNEVTSFINHSSLDMVYPQWKDDGSGMVDPAPSVHIDKDVTILVNPLRMPKISVSKEATDGTTTIQSITLGGTVVYKIGITNTGDKDFVDPVILDILPTGVTFDPSYNNNVGVRYDSNTAGHNEQYEIDIETRSGKVTQYYVENGNEYGDAETAVIFKLKSPDPNKTCVIEAGSTIYLYFQANIKESAGMYEGDKIENDVYASTAKKAFHTTDNPDAYGFTDAGGNIPGTLNEAAKELDENGAGTGNVAQRLEGGMHEALASYAYNENDNKPIEYVWVPAEAEVTYNYASRITLKKAVWGDRDGGYEESKYFLAMSTRTNVPDKEDGTSPLDYTVFNDDVYYDYGSVGWTRWRLTVNNGSTRALNRLIIGDILPKPDDGRLSSWESVWCGILGVKNGDTAITEGTGENKYTMFYYVGSMESVIDIYNETTFELISKGELTKALEATTYWNETNNNIARPADTNWKTLDEITDYTTIKAFIIVFDKDVTLQPSSDLVASYQTTVANMTDGTQFNNEFAFKNDNNVFRMNFNNSTGPLTSNQVSVTLMDKPVSVEGDLWIDEDWDGVQNKGNANAEGTLDWTTNGNRRDYSQYAIIRELIESTKYTITDLRQGQGTLETDLGLDEYIGYGESIEHFRFEELIPGAIAYLVTSEDELYDAEGNLLKDKLRTFEPARYSLTAEIRNAALMNIFKLTDKGTNYYRSNNPDVVSLTENIDNYILDDNFYQAGNANNVFVTKPFFIRYSTNVDKTKDIGLQMFRDVVIVKQALDNAEVKIKDAKFEIYGPYGDSTIGERLESETPASGSPLHFSYQDGVYALVELVDNSWIRVKDDVVVDAATVVTELVTDANGKITVSGLNWWKEYDIKEIEAPEGYDRFGAVATADETVGTQIEDLGSGIFTLMVPSVDKTSEMGPDQVTVENPRPVKMTPKVTKLMSDDSEPLKHDTTFTFVLTATEVVKGGSYWMDASADPAVKTFIMDGKVAGTTASTWTKTITVKKGETVGTVLFDDLFFIKTGTYRFTITETAGTDTHIIYDGSTWEYTVVVSNNEALELVASESYAKLSDAEPAEPAGETESEEADSAVFVNKYIPDPTKWQAQVQKVMSKGEPTVADKTFEFRMTAVSVTEGGSFWMEEKVKKIIAANDFWTVEITVPAGSTGGTYPDVAELFNEITFSKAGTYVFKIEEVKPATALAGITYADDYVTVTITVTDPEDENSGVLVKTVDAVITKIGTADVTVEKANDDLITTTFKFTNKYTVEPVKVIPQVDKTLTMKIGPTYEDIEFTFELTPATGTGFTIAKHQVNGEELDGNITKLIIPAGSSASVIADFGEITFTKAGTYVFKIREVKNDPAPEGVTFDETEWTLTIVVTDNDGVLTETHNYSHGEGETAVSDKIAKFVNNYDYEADGKIGLEARKVLNGRKLKKGEFEFELRDENGNLLQTVKNDENGKIVFADLKYVLTDVGSHKYTVVEKIGVLGGVTYSEVEYTIIITVSDNGDGTLKVVRSDDIKDIVFENDYEAKGKIGLEGRKVLNGRKLKEGEFEFELYDENGNLLQTVKNDADGKIVFTELEYIRNGKTDDVGKHTYTVVEKLGNLGGVTYSEVKYTVIITVTDNEDGTLEVVRSDGIKDIVFTNEYEAKGKIGLEGRKVLNGRKLKEGEFEFELYDENGNLLETVKNDADGKIVFTELEYIRNSKTDDVGKHTYTVVEKLGNLGGVTYSEVKYTVIITVTDNEDGTLKVERSDGIKDIVFTNDYEAKGKIGLEGRKVLNGRKLKEGEFEFELYDEAGNLLQTVKNDADGKIVFTDLEYILNSTISDLGTHKYTVVEKLGNLGGVTYSTVKYTIEITVTDNEDGTLKVVRSDDIKDIVFENDYEAKGKIGLEGRKVLNGRKLKEGEFEFELYDEAGNLLQTVKNDADGKIVFTDLEYIRNSKTDDVGTHKYTVIEKLGSLGGVTYSEVKYTVIITVTDNEDGTLEVVRSDGIKDIVFTNEYEAKGKIGLEGRKVLNGRKLKEGEFEFELYDEAGNLLETVKNDADGKIVFTDLEYILNSTISDLGTHKYTVVEKLGNLGGVTYSTVKYTIEITVTDNEDGTLKVVRSDDIKDIVFENDYEAKGKIGLEAKKILNGRKLKEGEFEFELYDETGKLLETVKNDANGKIVFTDLEYIRNSTTDDVGTHKYTVVEKLGNLGGVTYSEVKYTVIITVTDNEDGTLNVVRSDGIKDIEFINTYDAEGKIGLEGRKVLNGRKLKEGEFEFELYDEDGNLLQTVKNDADGKIVFADLEYVLEDVGFYKYTVVEKLGNLGGVTYSDVEYSVFVKVADNGDGTLKVVRFDDIEDIVFENDYEAKGKIGLEAKKILNGRKLKEGEFEFELYDEDGNLLETVKNDADGKIVFTDLEYIRNKTVDDVGTHKYTVVEKLGTLGGVTYTDVEYTVIITVTDNEDGTLKVVRSDDIKDIEFVNEYEAKGKIGLEAKKILNGRKLKEGEFEFELYDENGKLLQTVKNDVNGKIVFTDLEFIRNGKTDDVGTHKYTVVEKLGNLGGVTYTDVEYTVIITVTDNEDGTLTVVRSDDIKDIVFENDYEAKGKIGLEAKKILNGRKLKEGEFEFELYDEAGNLLETVKNDADGKIVFTDLEYIRNKTTDDVGTHKYTVVEKLGTLGGVTYTDVEYTVIITVTDNEDGTLNVVRSDDIKDIVFENDYEAKGKIGLEGKKILNGRKLKEGEFEFELYDEAGNLLETVKNDADGKVVFTDLEYIRNKTTDDVGTHKYTVVEKLGTLGGVTYTDVEYTVIITVTDNEDGTLTVVRSDDIKDIVFENDYEAKGKIGLEAKKILNGRKLKEGEFEFELYDENGKLLQTVKNDVNGKIVFTDLEYIRNGKTDDVGTHKYTVVEKLGNLGGVTYTDVEYTVIITVTDNEDGTLNVVRSDDIEDLEFVNEYEAKGKIGLEAKKILNGRKLKEGEFEFELYDEAGNLLQTVKNDADGKIVFTDLEYIRNGKTDDVGTHKYTVVEKLGNLGGVTYTDVEYTVIITVTDNEDGTLNVVRSDDIENLEFVNEYEAKGKIGLEAKKILNGRKLKEGEFEFELYDEAGNLLETVKNDADGKIVFTDLEYILNSTISDVGTHKYTVVEKLGNLGGVTYTDVEYTVIITVTDNEDGTLNVVRDDDIEDLEFVNEYEAKGKIGLEAKKILNGRELKEGEFEFELYDEAGNLLETVKNDADGKIVFTDLEYVRNGNIDDVGTHKYTVVEKLGNLGGVTYTDVEYTVIITVTDNEDGTLTVVRDDEIEDLEFVNTYDATGEIGLEARKVLNGRELKGGEFEFELYDEAGKLIQSVVNNADGTVVFDNLKYTLAEVGQYKFKLIEKAGELFAITFDDIEYEIIVTVTDNGDGTLNVVRDDDIKDLVFTNSYDVTEAGVKKIWKDNDNQDGIRPKELVVALMNGDVKVTEVTLNEENGWSYTVTNLPKYDKGVEIDYTWVEIKIPEGYTLESMTKEGVITSIVNPHIPEKVNIEGGKLWTGETCAELTRPVSITVKLYADGVEIRSIEVSSINDWRFSFTDLDKYKDGKEIVYTLGEVEVPGYITKIDDEHYIIVNDWMPPEPPQTGDYDVLAFAGIVMIAFTGLFIVRKKRKVNEAE